MLAVPHVVDAFAGVVLAGGRSSRMGRDKASLVLHQRTLLDRAIGLLHAAGASRTVVSGSREPYECIPDAWAHAGPVGGIASCLAALADGPVIFVPVDTPALAVDALHGLLGPLTECPAAAYALHPLPLAIGNCASTRQVAASLLARPGSAPAVHELFRVLGGRWVDAGRTGSQLHNVNTPEEWAEFSG